MAEKHRTPSHPLLCTVGALVAALSITTKAAAEEPADAPAQAVTPDAPSRKEVLAETAYRRAVDEYAAGRKAAALRSMHDAYALAPHPELLYDVAKIERELGLCRDALRDFRRFLDEASPGATHDLAKRSVAELDARCGRASTTYFTPTRIIGWSAIGAGVAAGIGAIYFAAAGSSAQSDVEHIAQSSGATGSHTTWDTSGYPRERDGERDNVFAAVFAATAGTLIAGGTLLLVLTPHRREAPPTGFAVGPSRGGSVLTYSARF